MPFSEPEPEASPLLVGALIPPLVPPALLVMSDRCTTVTSPGSVVLGWFLENLSRSTSRSAARSSESAEMLLFALTRGSTGTGVGLAVTGAFSRGFSGFGGGGGGGGGGGSITRRTTPYGKDSVFCPTWRGGMNHM